MAEETTPPEAEQSLPAQVLQKLQALRSHAYALREENIRLQRRITAMEDLMTAQKQREKQLKEELRLFKLAEKFNQNRIPNELKAQVDALIREIDDRIEALDA